MRYTVGFEGDKVWGVTQYGWDMCGFRHEGGETALGGWRSWAMMCWGGERLLGGGGPGRIV